MAKDQPEQLLLFEGPCSESDMIWQEIKDLKKSHDKIRKRLFKEIRELQIKVVFQSKQRDLLINRFFC